MPYATSHDHLLDELDRLESLLKHHDSRASGTRHSRDDSEPVRDPTRLPLAVPEAERAELRAWAEDIDRECEETPSTVTLCLDPVSLLVWVGGAAETTTQRVIEVAEGVGATGANGE